MCCIMDEGRERECNSHDGSDSRFACNETRRYRVALECERSESEQSERKEETSSTNPFVRTGDLKVVEGWSCLRDSRIETYELV